MSTIKGQYSACGWTTKRHLKNMTRPCPKCGEAVHVHKDDHEPAIMIVVLSIIGMVLIGIVFVALGIAKP